MSKTSLKIAIIGDYNFTFNTHHATNLAIDHASYFLGIEINYYWIRLSEACLLKSAQFLEYDGVWFSPGPHKNPFLLDGVIDLILKQKIPTFITGDAYKSLIDVFISKNNLNGQLEKLISENLIVGELFQRVEIIPNSKALIKLYENHNTIELTSSRFSLYPQLISYLAESQIDIEAYNEFEEPEIISLKSHPFFLACGFCPQISSTREIPHPLVYTFVKACMLG
jgi:CTP synthase (UTP-ammonia lyase)